MEENHFRKQVVWTAYILCILVVLMHSENAVLFLGEAGENGTVGLIETLIGERIAQIAVPGFFMLSSYLFFRNYTLERTQEKWNRRLHSIVIPYLLWNTVYYLGYCIASRVPGLKTVTGKTPVFFSFLFLLDAALNGTYNYVFWFVYQLILLIIISPVIYLFIKKKTLGIITGVVLLVWIFLRGSTGILNADALFYYLFAAYLCVHHREETENPGGRRKMVIGILLFTAVPFFSSFPGYYEKSLFCVILRTAGAYGLWMILSSLPLKTPGGRMKNTFLMYATHYAFVRLTNKTADLFLHGNGAAALILFFLIPVLTTVIVQAVSACMRKHVPAFYRLISGNR